MIEIDDCGTKKSVPVWIALLLIAQLDLASAFGWPQPLLSLLHLTAANNDLCSGVCAGLGTSIDVLVLYQIARMWAKRALRAERETENS